MLFTSLVIRTLQDRPTLYNIILNKQCPDNFHTSVGQTIIILTKSNLLSGFTDYFLGFFLIHPTISISPDQFAHLLTNTYIITLNFI